MTYLAAAIAIGVIAVWVALGAHCGWTMTSIPHKAVDEVTGIEFLTYERRFVPGVDFLGTGLLAAGVLALAARVVRHSSTKIPNVETA